MDEMASDAERPAWLEQQRAESKAWLEKRDAEWAAWFEAQKAEWRLWRNARDAEQKSFFRELLEHNARINAEMIAGLQEFGAKMSAEIDDQREQIRANTQAVLRALDRLGPESA